MVGRRPIPAEPRNKRLPPRTPLSRERVLDAALHIVDTEGVQALSMRHLAQALDREAMSLYRYATTKAALLDGVVELVLSELTVNPDADDWRQELRELARDFRHLALAHPDMVPLLVTRPLSTPWGCAPRAPCARWRTSSSCSPTRASPPTTHSAPTGCSSGSCTATSSTNCRKSWTTPRRPTTCCASDCTDCPAPNSPTSAPSPPNWPATTAPPTSTKASR